MCSVSALGNRAPPMADLDSHIVTINSGRLRVWHRVDGLFGVTWFPNEVYREARAHSWTQTGRSWTSAENHEGFPTAYERGALIDWAKEHIGH
jgi:hypothetical protein